MYFFCAIHCYCYIVVIWKQFTINSIMSQCINKSIQSMDLSKVLLHSTTIKYYITLIDRIYNRILSDIYTSFAPWKYILLFKFVWILINVRKLLFYVYLFHCSIVLFTFLFLHVWACPMVRMTLK